jgi:DNA-binding IclR family transcriptional regulator
MHDAAHATAVGKCLLGQLPLPEREDYLARHPLHDLTPRTVVDGRRLRLPAPGEVAVDDGEYALGVCCLAAAVVIPEGTGAVGVVTARPDVQRTATRQALLAGADRVSRALAVGSVVA